MTKLSDPRFPIVTFDTDQPLSPKDLRNLLVRPGVTLLIRSATGNQNRGGYYFQVGILDSNYALHPFDQNGVNDFYIVDFELLLKLINHMSGRKFDKDAFLYVRQVINMRADD
ncbi:MAG: hypothetical protein Q4B77_06455 [Coriobacteriaceae bacterium]|nr:hypothetical protein [Coriobacteriaceae bacterium]